MSANGFLFRLSKQRTTVPRITLLMQGLKFQESGSGASRSAACAAAGVGRTAFYEWLKDPEFRERIENAEAACIASVEDAAYRCALHALDDPRYQTSMIFWLKTRAGYHECERSATKSEDASSATPQVDFSNMTPKQIRDFIAMLDEDEDEGPQ